jgi:hypothetical protein
MNQIKVNEILTKTYSKMRQQGKMLLMLKRAAKLQQILFNNESNNFICQRFN